ncbi:metallophosphoesterase family protein [Virgibacillus xinjiangensis]|uniref:Phosphoesterase n=1 Tax=Virgibacillus xinjiangensis TaxID=393090 RepID=A0ABV7CVT7_9BACI
MKIVVIADTHMSEKGTWLPERLENELKTTDLIIHAGDWKALGVYHMLSGYAEVKGVYGNVDGEDIQEVFPEKQLVELNGYKIGVVHGHGEKKTTDRRALEAFERDEPDIIIFGHSHIPLLRYYKKKLLLNPGSPTDKRTNPYYSFAVLQLGRELKAGHVFYKDKT